MSGSVFLEVRNGVPFAAADLPELPAEELRRAVLEEVGRGGRICALYARPASAPAGPASAPEGRSG